MLAPVSDVVGFSSSKAVGLAPSFDGVDAPGSCEGDDSNIGGVSLLILSSMALA